MTTEINETQFTEHGIAELARLLAAGEVSSADLVEVLIARIDAVQPQLNAMTVMRLDEARRAAVEADRLLADARATGATPPPLCGVPITVKDCFNLVGTTNSLGIERINHAPATEDAVLVSRLRKAGAIVLGKTNIPQLMLLHCCDNPLFGRTLHPVDSARGPGGSSGGEAAIVAAGASSCGLASDLGGSIRQPAHACGLVGFKPTSGRTSGVGGNRGLAGMDAIRIDAGPIARTVDDADVAMRAMLPLDAAQCAPDESYKPWTDYRAVAIENLSIATAETDHWFHPAPTCRRAVDEAGMALVAAGTNVTKVELTDMKHAMRVYFGLVGADGFRSVRRMLRGSRVDWQVRRQVWFAGMPQPLRWVAAAALRLFGQPSLSRLLSLVGPKSADLYWQLNCEAKQYRKKFWQDLDAQAGRPIDAVVLPPHALPALRHGTALDLLAAASYCYLGNLLGAPAGVVPWTTIRNDEQHYPHRNRFDLVMHLARRTMENSAGLPIGVQVLARPWRDDVALAVMAALERAAPA